MKTLTLVYFILMFMWGLCFFLVGYQHISQHENVHQAIFLNYGLESNITINDPLTILLSSVGGYTVPIIPEGANYSDFCGEICESLHSQNEIVGYNTVSVMLIIFTATGLIMLCFYFLIGYIESYLNRERYELP